MCVEKPIVGKHASSWMRYQYRNTNKAGLAVTTWNWSIEILYYPFHIHNQCARTCWLFHSCMVVCSFLVSISSVTWYIMGCSVDLFMSEYWSFLCLFFWNAHVGFPNTWIHVTVFSILCWAGPDSGEMVHVEWWDIT